MAVRKNPKMAKSTRKKQATRDGASVHALSSPLGDDLSAPGSLAKMAEPQHSHSAVHTPPTEDTSRLDPVEEPGVMAQVAERLQGSDVASGKMLHAFFADTHSEVHNDMSKQELQLDTA